MMIFNYLFLITLPPQRGVLMLGKWRNLIIDHTLGSAYAQAVNVVTGPLLNNNRRQSERETLGQCS